MICETRTDKEVLTISVCLYCGNSKLMVQQKVRCFLRPQELFLDRRNYFLGMTHFIRCQSVSQY